MSIRGLNTLEVQPEYELQRARSGVVGVIEIAEKPSVEALRLYYNELIAEYFPEKLAW